MSVIGDIMRLKVKMFELYKSRIILRTLVTM